MDNFTKADLKTGMIVRLKNDQRYIVMLNPAEDGRSLIKTDGGWMNLDSYTYDLKHKSDGYTVIEVLGCDTHIAHLFSNGYYDLNWRSIWQRKTEPKRMTVDELIKSHKEHTGEDVEVEPLFREVKRVAKVGEWVRVIDESGHQYDKGIYQVYKLCVGNAFRGHVYFGEDGKGNVSPDKYVVLENYCP